MLQLIDWNGVSHGLADGTPRGRGSDQGVQPCVDVAQATARALDPQSRVRRLRLLGIPTWLLVPGHQVDAALYACACAVSFLGPGTPDLTSLSGGLVTASVEHKAAAAIKAAPPATLIMVSSVRLMEEHLAAFPHAKTTNVVIFGNAIQTAGPVNLADPVQLADPVTTLRAVTAQGLLPRNSCAGWRVHMVDGSLTPAGGLSALQDEQLREFWREFFAWCGGRLVLWDSTLTAFPASGQVEPASWATPGHREIIVQLAASVLFEPDQAVLLPSAGRPSTSSPASSCTPTRTQPRTSRATRRPRAAVTA